MANPHDIKVGQKLFFVGRRSSYRNSGGRWYEVEKIGTKWATTKQRERFDLITLWADGGQYSSPGRFYLSEEDYIQEKELNQSWDELRQRLSGMYSTPKLVPALTMEEIRALADRFQITLRTSQRRH